MSPIDSVTINLTTKILSLSSLSNIFFEITSDNKINSKISGTLKNLESFNTSSPNEKLYSGIISFNIQRRESGIYYTTIYGFDQNNVQSNLILTELLVEKNNSPPILFNLIAPDTLTVIDVTQQFRLSVAVSDSDGISDVIKVFFNSTKPDGNPANGNPFYMYDDGNTEGTSGDEKANDGVYSLIIQMPSSTIKGKYRFEFQAIDRSNANSNILTHYLVVK
jgi:hypothetical protein